MGIVMVARVSNIDLAFYTKYSGFWLLSRKGRLDDEYGSVNKLFGNFYFIFCASKV